jgi:hypothetical protein
VVKVGNVLLSGRYHNDLNTRDTLDTQLNVLADFQPKASRQKCRCCDARNLHPIVQSSVLDQMETKPKLVVLDTMNFGWIVLYRN